MTSFLIFASDSADGSRSVLFWLLGSLSLAGWGVPLVIVSIIVALTVLVLTGLGRRLDALSIEDETAQTLGVDPDRFRVRLLLLVALRWPVVQDRVRSVADFLLAHLSLLFVPVGVGVITQLDVLAHYGLRLAVVLVLSTWIGMAVSALLLRWLMRRATSVSGQ